MTDEKHCNHSFVVPRRGLPQINGRLTEKGTVTVAFLGGSITEGAGASEADTYSWRALTLVSSGTVCGSGVPLHQRRSGRNELNFRCSSITGACPAAGHN